MAATIVTLPVVVAMLVSTFDCDSTPCVLSIDHDSVVVKRTYSSALPANSGADSVCCNRPLKRCHAPLLSNSMRVAVNWPMSGERTFRSPENLPTSCCAAKSDTAPMDAVRRSTSVSNERSYASAVKVEPAVSVVPA